MKETKNTDAPKWVAKPSNVFLAALHVLVLANIFGGTSAARIRRRQGAALSYDAEKSHNDGFQATLALWRLCY